ncbi:MAG TPA: helix-turn-helix domain-containing protein [archaeon]|nr:helix-turn-helix domain-containing protein [archaeon]
MKKENHFNQIHSSEETQSLPILKSSLKLETPRRSKFKLTIRKVDFSKQNDFDSKIAWICSSLGFFEMIDKNKNAAAIFKEIFLATSMGQVLTSTTIAQRIGMSRGSTINHLNNLVRSGLIEKNGRYYYARNKTMGGTINEIEDDLLHIFSRIKKVAENIDAETGNIIRMK